MFSVFWREEGERTELGKEVEDRKMYAFGNNEKRKPTSTLRAGN